MWIINTINTIRIRGCGHKTIKSQIIKFANFIRGGSEGGLIEGYERSREGWRFNKIEQV